MWLAAIALVGSVLGLRLAWGHRSWRAPWLALAMMSFAASVALVSANVGSELGLTLALAAFTVPAYAVVVANATRQPRREPPDRVVRIRVDAAVSSKSVIARWLIACFMAAVAAVAFSAAAAAWLPGAAALRTVLAVLAMPLLWATFAGWCLATRRPLRTCMWLAFCAAGGASAVLAAMLV